MKTADQESGVVLVAVVCMATVAAVLALGLLGESSARLKLTERQMNMDQAFYIAEGGAERACAYITSCGTNLVNGTTITGMIGNGRFQVTIVGSTAPLGTGEMHTVSGRININPNNSPENEFFLLTTDGRSYTREDLANDELPDYAGTATFIHVKPKGNFDQTDLNVDSTTYTLERNTTYTFTADSMSVVLTNDNRNPHGKAVGQWWIYIAGNNVTLSDDTGMNTQALQYYTFCSIGTVGSVGRLVVLEGVHQTSWAKYALWYNGGPGSIQITTGEQFDGPVHANTWIYLSGRPVFNALISTTRDWWGSGSSTRNVDFNAGWLFNAQSQALPPLMFTNLLSNADMIVTGKTAIGLSGTNMLISNSRRGWSNALVGLPSNGVIYVKNYTTPGSTSTGTVSIGGTLDGRLSIVADYDIQITNHVYYANTNIALDATNISDDALGLIAKHDVVVMQNSPSNLYIYAHIIADGSATTSQNDGSFRVNKYNTRGNCGNLNVMGGIVQFYRGYVGSGSHGFWKQYTFDTRFTDDPPPQYPAVTNEYQFKGWRDKPL